MGVVLVVGVVSRTGADVAPSLTPPWSSLPTLTALSVEIATAASQGSLPSSVAPPTSAWSSLDTQQWTGPLAPVNGCWPDTAATTVPRCEFGDRQATRTMAVIGDSQAWMWVPALDLWGVQQHWKIRVFAKAGCSSYPLTIERKWSDGSPFEACARFNSWTLEQLGRLRPATIMVDTLAPVVGSHTYAATLPFEKSVATLVSEIRRFSTTVGVFSNIPYLAPPAVAAISPLCPARFPTALNHCVAQENGTGVFSPTNDAVLTYVRASLAVPVIPVDQLECANSQCPMVVGSRLVYSDASHVNRLWASHVARALGDLLAKAVPAIFSH